MKNKVLKKRVMCEVCEYPVVTCVCKHISLVSLPCEVIILQHPKEAVHAKNTVRLFALVAPQTTIISISDNEAMEALHNRVDTNLAKVFYPSEHSVPLENEMANDSNINQASLIFIDASWRQAYGIWQSFPWLQQCQQLHFSAAPSSAYHIRCAKADYQLSTLEAASYALSVTHDLDTSPFYDAFSAMQNHWSKFSP